VCYSKLSIPQPRYAFDIFFKNVCSYPIQIEAFPLNISESLDGGDKLDKQSLDVEKSLLVFWGIESFTDIHRVIPENYTLKVSVGKRIILLDKAKFLEVLKKSDYAREKCGIICRTDYFIGTIKDASLCP
jgi:hypothetical protein